MNADAELVNGTRYWACTASRTLFGEHALEVVWGARGAPRLRRKLYLFDDERALERSLRRLLATRARHGYVARYGEPQRAAR